MAKNDYSQAGATLEDVGCVWRAGHRVAFDPCRALFSDGHVDIVTVAALYLALVAANFSGLGAFFRFKAKFL
ncbi:MAG: hypothetical protein JO051_04920 [Acidobacteriaceae bacterium]|nr:hypothetical protein [Acidobacteriaceae bacterium]